LLFSGLGGCEDTRCRIGTGIECVNAWQQKHWQGGEENGK
jgi:hypothetical protein